MLLKCCPSYDAWGAPLSCDITHPQVLCVQFTCVTLPLLVLNIPPANFWVCGNTLLKKKLQHILETTLGNMILHRCIQPSFWFNLSCSLGSCRQRRRSRRKWQEEVVHKGVATTRVLARWQQEVSDKDTCIDKDQELSNIVYNGWQGLRQRNRQLWGSVCYAGPFESAQVPRLTTTHCNTLW